MKKTLALAMCLAAVPLTVQAEPLQQYRIAIVGLRQPVFGRHLAHVLKDPSVPVKLVAIAEPVPELVAEARRRGATDIPIHADYTQDAGRGETRHRVRFPREQPPPVSESGPAPAGSDKAERPRRHVRMGIESVSRGARGGEDRRGEEGNAETTRASHGATAVLALCAGATSQEAALVANLVASITIQQLATTGMATPPQLGPRLEMWRSQISEEPRCDSRPTTSRT